MRAMPSTAVKAHNRSAMAQYLYGARRKIMSSIPIIALPSG